MSKDMENHVDIQVELYAISEALKELVELNEDHRPGLAMLLRMLADKVERVARKIG
ncbi:hypothetical protein [Pseudodesulfovibrio nedwellii]|uniref:hypothetical protein n=1 Tax=Pseudodesulfovibrio nedwellii TaxID=2973072 RepID=UPI00248FABF7|nr:hypothetical protein [Pseudodesulfovibrio nedwellii]